MCTSAAALMTCVFEAQEAAALISGPPSAHAQSFSLPRAASVAAELFVPRTLCASVSPCATAHVLSMRIRTCRRRSLSLSLYPPTHLPAFLPMYPCTYLPMYLSTYLPVYVSTYQPLERERDMCRQYTCGRSAPPQRDSPCGASQKSPAVRRQAISARNR